ncbi:uncharacterized protein LOC109726195 isoform X3 [Ananas comosus]|uniref:Uncharacterized protein LOC109726195 isoform X3 n=2 Tax=Ananas comosus TaxID=4615 RepID=A0A6P5GTU2_ANACO|nr:uncharacterized protein LOC109726195 isoform X3 [Ananas comosus]XP_020111267.1 uncharacterized protein LOC109726195 isoform X3 [Ananas comosus]XP_020111268.1 uncharacterized protein LOC109726195 isoform X3 [Ananas comosus]
MDFAESSSAASRVSGCHSFSIRDYVRETRKNGVTHNWPFPQQYLEFCMAHGISEVLPPIEPRGLETSAAYIGHVKLLSLVSEKSTRAPDSPDHKSEDGKKTEIELVNILNKVQLLSLSDGVSAKDDSCHNQENKTTEAEADRGRFDLSMISKVSSPKDLESTLLEEEAHLLLKIKDARPDKEALSSQKSLLESHYLSESARNDSVPDILFCSQLGSNHSTLTSNANLALLSIGSRRKRRKRKQKHKKCSMQDICARAKPFTLEELERRNGLTPIADLSTTPSRFSSGREDNILLKEQSISVIYGGKSNLKDASILRKHPRDENLAHDHYDSKRRQLISRKSQGSKIKQQKGKLISLMAGKSKKVPVTQ